MCVCVCVCIYVDAYIFLYQVDDIVSPYITMLSTICASVNIYVYVCVLYIIDALLYIQYTISSPLSLASSIMHR